MTPCYFCRVPVDPSSPFVWRMVSGWVGGPKRNGFTLQSKPTHSACDACIKKQQAGHAPDEQVMEFGND